MHQLQCRFGHGSKSSKHHCRVKGAGLPCWYVLCHRESTYWLSKVKLVTLVESDLKAPYSIATTPRCREECYAFPGLLHFTLDPYFIMLNVKHFLSLWYDLTWVEPPSPGPLANTLLIRSISKTCEIVDKINI